MGKWTLCVRWPMVSLPWLTIRNAACPAAFPWHASSKKNRPSCCLLPFRMATVLPLRTAWRVVGYPFASVPARCTTTINAVGNVVAETGRDLVFGTMARLSDLSMPLTGEVRHEPFARPSAAADSEERQICTIVYFKIPGPSFRKWQKRNFS